MALRRDSPHSGGRVPFFEGCLPVEEIARRGRLALAFGPMKPVGLVDPRTPGENGGQSHGENRGTVPGSRTGPCEVTVPGFRDSPRFPKRPFAVVQLRRENAEGTMYNLVGFQTRLRQGEQQRVFRMIPGLEKATFLRFGSIHRNTYLDSPKVLLPTLQTRARPDLFIAGQLTGVEGYVESIGAGLVAGVNAAQLASGEGPVELPREMMMGSLLAYISGWGQSLGVAHGPAKGHSPRFQPMNANFGLLPACGGSKRLRGRDKRRAMAERALAAAREFGLTIRQQPA